MDYSGITGPHGIAMSQYGNCGGPRYGTALDEAERPVVNLGSGIGVVLGVLGKPGVFFARHETCSQSQNNKAARLLSLSIRRTRVPTSTSSAGKPTMVHKVSRP